MTTLFSERFSNAGNRWEDYFAEAENVNMVTFLLERGLLHAVSLNDDPGRAIASRTPNDSMQMLHLIGIKVSCFLVLQWRERIVAILLLFMLNRDISNRLSFSL